jgi:TorA maturation chaperone TorD
MIDRRFPTSDEQQRRFFDKHLAPWIGRFFADLATVEGSSFYRPLGAVGRLFIDIETEAMTLPA